MGKYTILKIKQIILKYDASFVIQNQKLYYLGEELENNDKLNKHNIGPESTINIIFPRLSSNGTRIPE